jgi:hypothetical protein
VAEGGRGWQRVAEGGRGCRGCRCTDVTHSIFGGHGGGLIFDPENVVAEFCDVDSAILYTALALQCDKITRKRGMLSRFPKNPLHTDPPNG